MLAAHPEQVVEAARATAEPIRANRGIENLHQSFTSAGIDPDCTPA
jgi:hypothetical protein